MNGEAESTARFRTNQPGLPLSVTIDPPSLARLLELLREALEAALPKSPAPQPALQEPKPQPTDPVLPTTPGLDLKVSDKLKATDVRMALLMGKIPEDAGLLIGMKLFAHFLNISPRMLARLQAEEAIPAPVRLGKLKRWRLAEILEWIEADCPPQRVWVQKRQDWPKRKGK